jgi:hypothetical protein
MFRHSAFAITIACMALTTGPACAAINAADYGVSAGNADNAAALERAFQAGRGQDVILPSGTIRYSREVRADSVRIKGNGTVMAPSNPDNQRIYLTGNSPAISDVRFDFEHTRRSGKGVAKAGVWVQGAKNFTVQNVTFNGHANGKPTEHGVGGGNLFIKNSQGGEILNNKLYGTLADAIHLTGGTRNVTVAGNYIENASDDGIAVVNYKDGSGGVTIQGNTVVGNRWGRNITAVGADSVQIVDNYVRGNSSDGAGIYIASEKSYGTAAPKNILVQGNSLQDTGGPGKGHGQLMIYAGNGTIDGVTVNDNEIRDSKRDDLAAVISGSTRGVVLEGNNIDGEISRRGSGNFAGNGNTTNDPKMASAAPVPNRPPVPGSSGGGPGGGSTGPGPGEYTPPTVPPSPTPDLTPRGSSAAGWRPNVTLPQVEQMRDRITNLTRPPNC